MHQQMKVNLSALMFMIHIQKCIFVSEFDAIVTFKFCSSVVLLGVAVYCIVPTHKHTHTHTHHTHHSQERDHKTPHPVM